MAAESPQEELWVPPRTFQALPTLSAQRPSPTLRSQINQRRNQKWVKLNRLSDEQLTQQSAQTDRGRTKAGFTRKIPDFQTREQAQTGLHWESAPDGGVISLASFSSPRAMALRLGLRVYHLPDEAELRFFSDQSSQGDVVMGSEIMDSVRKNLEAGDHGNRGQNVLVTRREGRNHGRRNLFAPGHSHRAGRCGDSGDHTHLPVARSRSGPVCVANTE